MRTVWQWEVHSTSALLEPLRARIKQDIRMQLWRVRAWMQLGNIHYKHETYGFPNKEDERQKKHSVSWSVQFHFSEETDAWAHVLTHAFHFFGSLSRPCPALRSKPWYDSGDRSRTTQAAFLWQGATTFVYLLWQRRHKDQRRSKAICFF